MEIYCLGISLNMADRTIKHEREYYNGLEEVKARFTDRVEHYQRVIKGQSKKQDEIIESVDIVVTPTLWSTAGKLMNELEVVDSEHITVENAGE